MPGRSNGIPKGPFRELNNAFINIIIIIEEATIPRYLPEFCPFFVFIAEIINKINAIPINIVYILNPMLKSTMIKINKLSPAPVFSNFMFN